MLNSVHSHQVNIKPLFDRIEQNNIEYFIQFFAMMQKTQIKQKQIQKFLMSFLAECNERYHQNISKEQLRDIVITQIYQYSPVIAENLNVYEALNILLDLNGPLFRNCGYAPGQSGELDDRIAMGLAGLLAAGLLSIVSISLPFLAPIAGGIASYSLYQLGEATQQQSTLNQNNPGCTNFHIDQNKELDSELFSI